MVVFDPSLSGSEHTALPLWHSPKTAVLRAAGPAAAVSELSSDRLELLAWLRRNAPSLAELYEGAVLMLQNRPPAHVRLIAHSVREIRNRLPDYVSKVKSGGRLDYTGRIDNITKIWVRVGLVPSDLTTTGLPPTDTSVAVPREAARPVLDLLRDHELSARQTR